MFRTNAIILISVVCLFVEIGEGKHFRLEVLSDEAVCEVEDRFLSIALGIGQAEKDFRILNYSSPKLKTLLAALKPAYLRLGGSAANFLFFKVGSTKPPYSPYFPGPSSSSTNNLPNVGSPVSSSSSKPKIVHGDASQGNDAGQVNDASQGNDAGQGNDASQGNDAKAPQSAPTKSPLGFTPFTPNIPESNSPTNVPTNMPNAGQSIQTTRQPPNTNQSNPNQSGLGQNNPQGQPMPYPMNPSPFQNTDDDDDDSDSEEGYSQEKEDEYEYAKNNEVSSGNDSDNDDDFESGSGDVIEKRDLIKRGKINEPFWLMSNDFDKFYNFINDIGLDMIFNLGQFVRHDNGSWNSTNALDMLHYIAYRQYNIGWQLGNEPNSYKKYGEEHVISGKQDGEDLTALRKILRDNPKFGKLLVGPDVTRPKGEKKGSSEKFLHDYLSTNASSEVSAVSWHQYYVDGRTATKQDFVDPDTLDLLKDQMERINQVMQNTKTSKPVWMTETGSAWGGGAKGLSDTYAASFMYLDKLGLAGVFCHSVVMRQSILSGSYAMLDADYTPRPDYWLALVHKGLVGKRVLLISDDTKSLRAYTHCTKESAQYPKGAITVMVLNLRPKPARISFKGKLAKLGVDQFLMTSSDGSLTTKHVLLNGKKLQLGTDNTLPDLAASKVHQPMKMPSYSYAFYVIPHAKMPQCL
eukprot:gene3354-3843_t